MYQAGIKNITLYENKGIDFLHYDPLNYYAITGLSGIGAVITIQNMQRPGFDIKLKLGDSGKPVQDYAVSFAILGYDIAGYADLYQIKTSIYGWCMLIEFYDGTFKFYDTPIFCRDSKINPHNEMAFEIEMKTIVPTVARHFEYTPNVSTVPIYRADTTILRADTTIYTSDYAL